MIEYFWPKASKRVRRAVGMVLSSFTVLAFALAFLKYFVLVASTDTMQFFYNSDLLYLPSLVMDIVAGRSLGSWVFPPAPYFFPDLALFLPIHVLTQSVRISIPLYGVAQVCFFLLNLSILAKRLTPAYLVETRRFLLLSGALLFCFLPDLPRVFTLALANAFHFGVLAVMPLALAWTIDLLGIADQRRETLRRVLMMVSLIALTVASDFLAIVQISLPLLGALGLLVLGVPSMRLRGLQVGVFVLAATMLGVRLNWLLVKDRVLASTVQLKLDGFVESGRHFVAQLCDFATVHSAMATIWIAFLFVTVTILAMGLLKRPAGRSVSRAGTFTVAFFLLSMLIATTATIATGRSQFSFFERYLQHAVQIPVIFGWPFIVVPLLAAWRSVGRFALATLSVVGTASLLSLASFPPAQLDSLRNYIDYYPPLVACVDDLAEQYGLRTGAAHYWQARPIQMLSKQGVNAVAVGQSMVPFAWITNLDGYRTQIDFVVVEPDLPRFAIDTVALVARYGEPAVSVDCGQSRVMIYNRSADRLFQTMLLRDPRISPIRRVGDRAVFLGADLPGPASRIEGTSRHSSVGEPGFISHGPYIDLPKGEYSFAISYRTSGKPGQRIGGWDVVLAKPTVAEVIAQGELVTTTDGKIRGTVTLDQAATVEVRVFGDGLVDVWVDQLALWKVE